MQVEFCLQKPNISLSLISLIPKIVSIQGSQLCREPWPIIQIALQLFYDYTLHDSESFAQLGSRDFCEGYLFTELRRYLFGGIQLILVVLISLFKDFIWGAKLLASVKFLVMPHLHNFYWSW